MLACLDVVIILPIFPGPGARASYSLHVRLHHDPPAASAVCETNREEQEQEYASVTVLYVEFYPGLFILCRGHEGDVRSHVCTRRHTVARVRFLRRAGA